ncbi:MAG: DMT family transporter [Chloroflexi bacterium]|nr:DMT family transporter [Chloroflexota bacterium]
MSRPYLAISISIVAVSFASVLILSCEAPPLSIAFYRILFTTAIVAPLALLREKGRAELLAIPRSALLMMVLIGLVLAAHFALWITSLTKTSVASSVVLVTAHPVFVAPVSHYLLKERLSGLNVIGIGIGVAGVALLVSGNYGYSAFALDTLEGNVLAMLGGLAAGLYILGGRVVRKTVSVFPYALVVYAAATLALIPICLAFGAPLSGLRTEDYLIILLMATVAGLLGHTLYNWSLAHIRAAVASVFLLGEPIGSSLLAYALPWIRQEPSPFTLGGGAVILLGIYLTARRVTPR